jgi:hypothetical protein
MNATKTAPEIYGTIFFSISSAKPPFGTWFSIILFEMIKIIK